MKNAISVICVAEVRGMQIGGDRRQRRQIHVDGEGADGGEQAEHDGVAGKGGHGIFFSCSTWPRRIFDR